MAIEDRKPWYEQGENPDYRFSLANERTFLAWIRTTLALIATAVVLDQIGLHSPDSSLIRRLGVVLCL